MIPVSRFFSALFERYPSDDSLRLEIRCLPPAWDTNRDGIPPRQWYTLRPEYLENIANACLYWGRDWDVYFGVLPRCGRSGSQQDVLWSHCLYCDVDGGDAGVPGAIHRIKEACIDLPDIAVQSGGGIHAYWLLDAPVVLPDRDSRETFKRTLRRLCRAIGGVSPAAHADTAACEVARILRVPGTFNHKRQDEPRPVKILRFIHSGSISRSYDWWRANLPMEPVQPGPKAHAPYAYMNTGEITPGLKRWAEQGYPEGKRHQDFASAAAWLVRDCKIHKDAARDLLLMKARNSPGRRPITDEEIEGILKWA